MKPKNELERMISGLLYDASNKELTRARSQCRNLLDTFNSLPFSAKTERNTVISELFGRIGNNISINKPFYCDYGFNIEVGDNFYANFDCIILDVCPVVIGNNVFLGPRVSILTASHPLDKDVRNTTLELGKKVVIGSDVWIGGSVVINPGVIIGDNVVIGSGSVVTKDIPSNTIAAGNPCKVLRSITDSDKTFWEREKEKYDNY